jgi:hypothetical protein
LIAITRLLYRQSLKSESRQHKLYQYYQPTAIKKVSSTKSVIRQTVPYSMTVALEDSGQGRQNRLLAALAPKDHSILTPHLNEMSFELGLLLLADLQKPMRGRDWRMRSLG